MPSRNGPHFVPSAVVPDEHDFHGYDGFSLADADMQVKPFTFTQEDEDSLGVFIWQECSVWSCWTSWRISLGGREEEQVRSFARRLGEIHLEGVHEVIGR